MRFSLFIHMERWDDNVSHRQLFEDLTELTLMAEAGGFGTVWIGEHHSMEYTISPSPMPLLAYLAGKTTTIRLGAGTIIAPFWHPDPGGRRVRPARRDQQRSRRDRLGPWRLPVRVRPDGRRHPRLRRRQAPARTGPRGAQAVARRLRPRRRDLAVPHVHQRAQADPAAEPADLDRRPRPRLAQLRRAHGCNVMVTPLMKGDEEVVDLKNKFDAALANNPDVPRPDLMVLRHTHVHAADDPDGWRPAARRSPGSTARSTPGSATRPPRSTASWTPARSRSSPSGPNSNSTPCTRPR